MHEEQPDAVDAPAAARRAPWHLWLVGALGVFWNAIAVVDYFMTQTRNVSYMSRFTPQQLEVLYALPAWLVGSWALAVWGGLLGALLLLLKRRIAAPVLLVSLLAMVLTAVHNFTTVNGLYATAGTPPAFVTLIFAVALGLWLYAGAMRKRGILS